MDKCILAQLIVDHLLPEHPEGGTYDPRTNTFPLFNDDTTYLVSVPGHEHRLAGIASAAMLIEWLGRVQGLLALRPHYLGWWRDGRRWWWGGGGWR